LYVISH